MTTITETIPSLGSPPLTTDPANFDTRADTLYGSSLPAFITATNAWAGQANTVAGEVNASAAAAAAYAGAEKWVSGQAYAEGDVAWSPINALVYRALVATSGTTDPSLSGDWFAVNAFDLRLIPQNSRSAAYELVLSDSGRHIFHPSADTSARTWTIPANSSLAFPIGTAVTFINQNGAGVITIAITADTMRLATLGSTGSRTLAANGVATAIKITSTEWIISGVGLT